MKKSEMILKLERFHHARYCMVEGGYITLAQYFKELLEYQKDLGLSSIVDDSESIQRKDAPKQVLKPYTAFGQTRLVPLETITDHAEDEPAKEKWDVDLWIERGEDWYALFSYPPGTTVRIIKREEWLNSEEVKTSKDEK